MPCEIRKSCGNPRISSVRRKPGGIPVQRKTVKRDESAQKIHPRPTHGFRQRRRPCRRGEGTRHAGILRSVYVRTHDARDNCEIRPEICPDTRTAQILWNALSQFRWKNNVIRFRILKIHLFSRAVGAVRKIRPCPRCARFRQRRRVLGAARARG